MPYILSCLLVVIALSGCQTVSNVFQDDDEPKKKLEGKRISILKHKSKLVADKAAKNIPVTTPKTIVNKQWTGQHVSPINHLALNEKVENNRVISIGSPADEYFRLTSNPVIAEDLLFSIDGQGTITARKKLDLDEVVWLYKISQNTVESNLFGSGLGFGLQDKEYLGGNLSYGDGQIFITTKRSKVIALNAKTGVVNWQREIKLPITTPPVYQKDRVFFITSANSLFAIDSKTGKTLWKHKGLKEVTGILGAAAPAVASDNMGDIVIVPYSSGELYGFDAKTGKKLWGHLLTGTTSKYSSLLALSDIDATPIIANNIVYAVGYEGGLSAIELRTGRTIWSQDVASVDTPWVAGEFIYIITTNNELACINAANGTIKWIQQLRHNEKGSKWSINDDPGKKIIWSGPVLAGDNVVISGSNGKIAFANPYRGQIVNIFDIPQNTYLPPIIVDKVIYSLSNDGELAALW